MSGTQIKALRESLHWTQEQMASYLCFAHRKEVFRIESEGATGPTKRLLELLAANPAKGIVEASRLTRPPAKGVSPALLARLRSRRGLTQAGYGALLGVTWWYVRDLESGKRRVPKRLSRLVLELEK